MADTARANTTVVEVPAEQEEDEAAEADVDHLTMITQDSDHSVITDGVVTTGAAVEDKADTTVALLPSVQDQALRTSTSYAILPLSLESS